MYAIIDIETTGGNSSSDRITEIAIYVHNGETVVDEFVTLINPERRIPYNISQLTGITNEMVADAPKFYEVAKRVVEITEGTIFVAHNAGFDYGFIRNAFKNLGYDYKREKLCTVRLARKIIPGYPSYSLGKLCRNLGIELNNRHRAAGDALATVKLFELLQERKGGPIVKDNTRLDFQGLGLHPNITQQLIDDLPKECGVYYFFDENDILIYIGKSVNIRSRLLSHFNNCSTKRAVEMRGRIARIDTEVTGSELVALLKESAEIKRFKPFYNRAQRRSGQGAAIFAEYDMHGYIRFRVAKVGKKDMPVVSFTSMREAKAYLSNMVQQYELCQKLADLYKTDSACFHFGINRCKGACIGKEKPETYNERAQSALDRFKYQHNNLFIVDEGRRPEERSLVCIENGRYRGFGYAEVDRLSDDPAQLRECIRPYEDNRNVRSIIRGYLQNNEVERLITFDRSDRLYSEN